MANKKFSEFVLKTSTSDVSHIVGYNGAENVQITPANFVTGGGTGVFLPLAGGTMVGNTLHGDNVKSIYGTSSDLEIYHDGSNSRIVDNGTGELRLQGTNLRLWASNGENYLTATEGGSVDLFHSNSKKLETTSTGISVSGAGIIENTSTATSDSVNVLDIKSLSSGTVTAGFGVGLGFFIENSVYSAVNEIGRIEVVETSTTNIDDKMIFYVKDNNTLAERLSIDGDNSRFATSVFINSVYTPNTLAAQLSIGSTADGNNGMSIVSGSTGQGSIFFADESNNDSGKLVYLHSNNSMQFSTNRTLKMLLDSSGNLGVGVSNPSDYVSVSAQNIVLGNTSSSNGLTVLSGTGSFGNLAFADGTSVDAQYKGLIQYGHTLNSMKFFTDNLVRMTIDSSGNLGLGTSSPTAKVTISGDNSTASPQRVLKLGESTGVDGNGQYIQFSSSSNDTLGSQIQGTRVGAGASSDLRFVTTTTSAAVTEKMRIDSAGNVGIGTVTPAEKLEVAGNVGINGFITHNGDSGTFMGWSGDDTNVFYTAGNERLRIDALGALTVGSQGSTVLTTTITENDKVALNVGDGTGAATGRNLTFSTGNSERMRLTSAGDLFIGATTTPDGSSHFGSGFVRESDDRATLYLATSRSTAASLQVFFNTNGIVGSITVNGTATSYNTSSDYRLKEDLQDFKGLDLVSKIPVYDYKWKADESRSYGVMAHELEEVLPQAVSGEKDAEEMQSVDYSKIVPLLVKSIQELSAKLEALECQCEKK